jgi:hypothetical protein
LEPNPSITLHTDYVNPEWPDFDTVVPGSVGACGGVSDDIWQTFLLEHPTNNLGTTPYTFVLVLYDCDSVQVWVERVAPVADEPDQPPPLTMRGYFKVTYANRLTGCC